MPIIYPPPNPYSPPVITVGAIWCLIVYIVIVTILMGIILYFENKRS